MLWNDTCVLKSAKRCRDKDIIIPERVYIKGEVIEIEENAFRDLSHIRSVTIPEGVNYIGPHAFENCKNLETLILPDSLRTICKGAFCGCESLKSIVLPPSLQTLGADAFCDCKSLKSIVLPQTITKIHDGTFAGCSSLERIDLRHIRSVGAHAFAWCVALKDIQYPDTWDEIDTNSFEGSGYWNQKSNWYQGTIRLGKWVIGCIKRINGYVVEADTEGIAKNVFLHTVDIRCFENPDYQAVSEEFFMALECPNAFLPDLLNTPRYLEEISVVRILYKGTAEQWGRIYNISGDKQIPVSVTAADQSFKGYL